jgi:hypothetical protein
MNGWGVLGLRCEISKTSFFSMSRFLISVPVPRRGPFLQTILPASTFCWSRLGDLHGSSGFVNVVADGNLNLNAEKKGAILTIFHLEF